jgi:hypothetical protein
MLGIQKPNAMETTKTNSLSQTRGLNFQNYGKGVINSNKVVSAGNIGGPNEKYDFKTIN